MATGLIIGFMLMLIVFPAIPGFHLDGQYRYLRDYSSEIWMLLRENSFWKLFANGRLPAVVDNYHGLLMAYLYLPFHAFFGANLKIIEFWHYLFAPVTLYFAYRVTRGLYGQKAGIFSLFLLVIHPQYIASWRMGATCWITNHFFSVVVLFFFIQWAITRKKSFWAAGWGFLGLGMSTMLWFYWFPVGLAALGGIYIVKLRRRFRRPIPTITLAGLALAALFVGGGMRAYYLFFNKGAELKLVFFRLFDPQNPHSLPHYGRQLWHTIRYVNRNFSAQEWDMFYFKEWLPAGFHEYLMPNTGNPLFPVFLWGSILFLLAQRRRRLAIFPVLFLVMLALSPLGSQYVKTALFFLYPFPLLIIAVATVRAGTVLAGKLWLRGSVFALLACFVFLEIRGVRNVFRLYDLPVVNFPIHLDDSRYYTNTEVAGRAISTWRPPKAR